jgi:hypothetical protein
MSRLLVENILATYERHQWRPRTILLSPESAADLNVSEFHGAQVREAEVDAIWFSRPSSEGREAWELRWIGEPAFALFETFESDEAEEEREDVRREMEARLRDRLLGHTSTTLPE